MVSLPTHISKIDQVLMVSEMLGHFVSSVQLRYCYGPYLSRFGESPDVVILLYISFWYNEEKIRKNNEETRKSGC